MQGGSRGDDDKKGDQSGEKRTDNYIQTGVVVLYRGDPLVDDRCLHVKLAPGGDCSANDTDRHQQRFRVPEKR